MRIKLWAAFLFLMAVIAGLSAIIAFVVFPIVSGDDCGVPVTYSLAECRDGRYLLDIGGGNITPMDSEEYVRYLEGVVHHFSGELDSLQTDDRYIAVMMTTETNPDILGGMGLRLPEGAKIMYTRGFNSGSWEEFPIDLYLDNRVSILGQPDAPVIKFGVVSFRYPKGEFPPRVEEIIPPGSIYQVDLTKAY